MKCPYCENGITTRVVRVATAAEGVVEIAQGVACEACDGSGQIPEIPGQESLGF